MHALSLFVPHMQQFDEEHPTASDFCQWDRNASDYLTGTEWTSQGALCVCRWVRVCESVRVLDSPNDNLLAWHSKALGFKVKLITHDIKINVHFYTFEHKLLQYNSDSTKTHFMKAFKHLELFCCESMAHSIGAQGVQRSCNQHGIGQNTLAASVLNTNHISPFLSL